MRQALEAFSTFNRHASCFIGKKLLHGVQSFIGIEMIVPCLCPTRKLEWQETIGGYLTYANCIARDGPLHIVVICGLLTDAGERECSPVAMIILS